jgi:hypothetical protein
VLTPCIIDRRGQTTQIDGEIIAGELGDTSIVVRFTHADLSKVSRSDTCTIDGAVYGISSIGLSSGAWDLSLRRTDG